MIEESLPKLTKAAIPVQTHTLKIEERLAKGKALRDVASRKAQKEWNPPVDRPDPVDLLIESSKGRVEDLLPIRYGRMMVSPFHLLPRRGGDHGLGPVVHSFHGSDFDRGR